MNAAASIRHSVGQAYEVIARETYAEDGSRTADKVVYLMRGLPASGKSRFAKELAKGGVLCETDAYIREPARLGLGECTMDEARRANFADFCQQVQQKRSPIVVDRGNGLNAETYIYVNRAVADGYEIRLVEPHSPWWEEIRTLLRYRPHTNPILEGWAYQLATINQRTNQVPVETILDWLDSWVADLTVAELLEEAAKWKREAAPTG